jgi:hypothetical protein
MKTLIQKPTSILWVVLVGFLAFTPFDSKAQQAEVSFQIFYDELAPHGRWLLHPKYGDVWAPNVQDEFTPYLTNGYWTVTQYGNTWVSNYDWGWATFHYGRWYFDEFEGWVWIPDTVWAPAWVVWRNGGGYYGWAAMSPGINFNVSLTLFDGIPGNYWCFVPQQYVWRPYLYRYCAPRHRNVYIVSHTTYVSHCRVNSITYNYYTGPSHTEITHVTNRPVVIHQVEHTNKPGRSQVSRDKIVMFTPVVKRNEIDRPALGSLGSNNGWGKGPVRGRNDNDGNDQGNGGNGSNGGQGNNGHGNGDQDAPGNSGGNNNGENSENSGQGNSGKGKGGNNNSRWSSSNSSDRTNDSNDNFENWKRSENNNVRSYRSSEIKKSSNTNSGSNNRSSWSNSGGSSNRSFSTGNSGNSSSNTKSYTPSRSNSSNGSNRTYTPSSSGNSGNSGKSYTPSRSSSSSGGNNRSITPSSGSSSGGSKSITPSRSGGGNNTKGSSNSGGSKSRGKN